MDRLPLDMRHPDEDKPIKTGKQGLAAEFSHQLDTGAAIPRDPAMAGTVGRRRATFSVQGNPEGNRAERRAARRGKPTRTQKAQDTGRFVSGYPPHRS